LTLPNILTCARIAAVPVIVLLFFVGTATAGWAVVGLFIAASITDWLDGYIARTRGLDSELGRLLDPLADKVMVAVVLLLMVGFDTVGGVHLLAVVVILAREIAVTGLREFMAERNIPMPVTKLAKWKTASQMFALTILLAAAQLAAGSMVELLGLVALWLSAGLTATTGWTYFRVGLAAAGTRNGS
jgi:cardiolipin synthase